MKLLVRSTAQRLRKDTKRNLSGSGCNAVTVGRPLTIAFALLLTGCAPADQTHERDLAATAERFFRTVYGCSGDRLDGIANPGVSLSYPIVQDIYGTPVIRGIERVQAFSDNFCRKWSETRTTIHEAVTEGNRVVLVWEFSATDNQAPPNTDARHSWGGISFFRFDAQERVIEEVGEESTPGPVARMRSHVDD